MRRGCNPWHDFVHFGVPCYDECSLSSNKIGADGAKALANALANNGSLQTLDIAYDNPAIEAALERNRALYKQSQTPLMQACKNGDISEAETLVVNGAPVDARDTLGQTALFYACKARDENIALLLLEILAAELSKARAKRSEEKAGLHHIMLRDFFAEQLSREYPSAIVADFDSQQVAVSEKEQALTTLQEAVKTDPEKIPQRNQVRRDLFTCIRETLAKFSEVKLQELEDDANDVADTCRKLWRDILGEPANVDDAAELVTFGQLSTY
ncbi:Ankyrin repeat and EF-hand domain-containing protein 1 [Hondaea fermentalgiana]|uniref:Ankyrin repeat and EF-hand domain-containing protein 1 n=1 Tax=Hondaea fermentalgiana TaxID=2315210 RepID=A0A2R5H3W9_9STRA|nr:Ankyrin repeat and EF-hand domain-containing protein 1 [Hondaea fermentalgiana]|eukprot:GBG35134.1 Ankyrin repeat and EF-hand domain-containing protein 1 [Hondaea fermentalgiana]